MKTGQKVAVQEFTVRKRSNEKERKWAKLALKRRARRKRTKTGA